MSYKFGQFRKGQTESYSRPLTYKLETEIQESSFLKSMRFKEKVINLSSTNILQATDVTGLKKRNYYLRYRIYKQTELYQSVTVKLVNTDKMQDNIQTLETVTIEAGLTDDYSVFDFVIPPNAEYNQILFLLNRETIDFGIKNDDGTNGREIKIEIEKLEEVENIIETVLNPKIENKGQLKQIGVQSHPGLQMCIDGESIRVGRSGLYEINNGIPVNFIGFIIDDSDKDYFILDYQY